MTKQIFRIAVGLAVILLAHSGCSMPPKGLEADRTPLTVNQLVKTARSWDGQLLPAYPRGQPEVTILRIAIPAGARLDSHRHPVINAGMLLRGQLTVVTTDGKTLYLKAGDPIVEVVNKWHYGINEGKDPAEIVVFYAGVVGTPITVLEKP